MVSPAVQKDLKVASLLIFWSFLTIWGPYSPALPRYPFENRCELLLQPQKITTQMLRYFRSEESFSERVSGTYMTNQSRVMFAPWDSKDGDISIQSPFVNSAAHLEILRAQLGDRRMNKAMSSSARGQLIANELRVEVKRIEDQDVVLDSEEILAEVEAFSASEALPQALEDKVFRLLRQMERLATPMVDWLQPKVLAHKLSQQAPQLLEDPVSHLIRPGVTVYRAIRVTVNLNGPKQFMLSAGKSGLADSVHEMVLQALLLAVPRARLTEKTSGYLVIQQDFADNPRKGRIDFVTKGATKSTLASELFEF
jgi:hypothetical protein